MTADFAKSQLCRTNLDLQGGKTCRFSEASVAATCGGVSLGGAVLPALPVCTAAVPLSVHIPALMESSP